MEKEGKNIVIKNSLKIILKSAQKVAVEKDPLSSKNVPKNGVSSMT